jgi:ribose transport system permease protein
MINRFSMFFIKYSKIILLLAIMIVSCSMAAEPLQNLKNVISSQAPFVLIYTLGMTLVIITGGLDLSQGSVAAFSSCLAGFLLMSGKVFPGIIVGLAVGALIGLLNGLLVTKTKISPFIATYGIDWVTRGAVHIMMGGVTLYGFNMNFKSIATGSFLGLSIVLWIAFAVFLVLLFVLRRTIFGRNVYTAGANIQVTRLTGINTDFTITIVYMISGVLAALAGLLYVARLDAAQAFLGKDFGLMAIAATLIGGTSLQGGKGGVGNSVIGVLIMVFLTNALNILKVSNLWQDAVFGIIIIVSALMQIAGRHD